MHNSFWRSSGCNFWGPCDTGSYIEGFIYAHILLLTTFSFIFLVLFDALKFERSEYIGMLIIMLISSILGYFIALGVNKTMGYYKNKRKNFEK